MVPEGVFMGGNSISGYEVTYVDDYWQENRRVVLIVEDHQIVRDGMRKIISDVLAGVGVETLEAGTLAEARRIIGERKGELDLVLLDARTLAELLREAPLALLPARTGRYRTTCSPTLKAALADTSFQLATSATLTR